MWIIKGRFSLSKQYNQIYEKLVANQKDYTGMVAYCIYKNEKRKWLRDGNESSEFVKLKLMAHEIAKYRKAADELLTLAYQANAEEEVEKIKKTLATELIGTATKSLGTAKGSRFWPWHNSGASGVFGNFYTGLVVAAFVWIFSSKEVWLDALKSATTNFLDFFS